MKYKHYQSQLSQLSARFNLMVALVLGLLISNTVLSSFLYTVWNHHTVEVTPFSGEPGYLKSAAHVDSHYLSLMTMNFISERLNVTPESVEANHERLLSFVNSTQYKAMLKQLNQEASIIKSKKISSVFYTEKMQVNPKALSVMFSGTLKRYVGLQALNDERKSYVLQFQYKNGRLSILHFSLFKEKNNA